MAQNQSVKPSMLESCSTRGVVWMPRSTCRAAAKLVHRRRLNFARTLAVARLPSQPTEQQSNLHIWSHA